ncbi:hypothetical protein AKO1_012280 [Acrasis kona]|uniref:Swt1-like HEPN domain-containing protein n=1 Tax=Acrasis kona TaxID=1008807 RepID=A0AAW2Z9B1_9EUKA
MNTMPSPDTSRKIHSMLGNALMLFNNVYEPFLKGELKRFWGEEYEVNLKISVRDQKRNVKVKEVTTELDSQMIFNLIIQYWEELFPRTKLDTKLNLNHKSYFHEGRAVRNNWAHQTVLSYEDYYRAFDTIERLLMAIEAKEQQLELEKMRHYILFKYANRVKMGTNKPTNATPSTTTPVTPVEVVKQQPKQAQTIDQDSYTKWTPQELQTLSDCFQKDFQLTDEMLEFLAQHIGTKNLQQVKAKICQITRTLIVDPNLRSGDIWRLTTRSNSEMDIE